MTADEQIIAAAGEPVVRTSDVLKLFRLFNSGKLTPNTIDGWTSALEIYELTQSTADAILSATKPLRERISELEVNASTMKAYYEQAFDDGAKRIAELKAEVDRLKAECDQAWSINPTTSEQLLRKQNAELTKQIADCEQANTDIHKWRNNYRREIARLLTQRNAIACAASDVIDRFNSPKWKDLPHTGTYIQALADAVELAKG